MINENKAICALGHSINCLAYQGWMLLDYLATGFGHGVSCS